jgi:hypothetical protein
MAGGSSTRRSTAAKMEYCATTIPASASALSQNDDIFRAAVQ